MRFLWTNEEARPNQRGTPQIRPNRNFADACNKKLATFAEKVQNLSKLSGASLPAQQKNRTMPAYDFTALSPIDFEILVWDLLQKEFGFTLESFKPGKDSGIDLRRFIAPRATLIVQCKHYAVSGLSALLRHLEREEAPKAKALKPKRYVLVTSVPLSPANKQTICELFKPYCKSPGDIYGRDDLNNLLGKYPDIEKLHLKLWINSTAVLESIIHSQLFNTSREELEKIQRRSKVYVYNQSFGEAITIINERNFCIIAGIPGIGKTTLAEMLVLHFLANGFELIRITSNIREASAVSGNKRRIFYYDDFLGQSSDADKLGKNEDQRLLDFFEMIRHSRVSKLILTTREYILNQARSRYEKLARTSFDLETCIVDLAKYTRMNRAEILFNHLYFSDLPASFKKQILENRAYLKIIDHPNYNPRFVELLTRLSSVLGLPEDEYVDFFLENLTNPYQLWSHAFTRQLTPPARDILIVLTTLPREVLLDDLRTAFHGFAQAKLMERGVSVDPNDFMTGCKELDGNFVSYSKSDDITAKFHNPSVRDFMQGYCLEQPLEMLTLLKGATFFEQLVWLGSYTKKDENEPAFRPLLLGHLELWICRLEETIDGPTISDYSRWGGGWLGVRSAQTFESRLKQLIAIRSDIDTPAFNDFITKCLTRVEERVASRSSDRRDIVSLVEAFDDLPEQFPGESKVALAAKELLSVGLTDLEDFKFLNRFHNKKPNAFDEAETELIRVQFKRVSEVDVERWLDGAESESPDDIRDCANVLKSVGKWLEIDNSTDIEALRSYAEEKEQETEWEPPDDDHRPSTQTEASDLEIASLFRSLRLK